MTNAQTTLLASARWLRAVATVTAIPMITGTPYGPPTSLNLDNNFVGGSIMKRLLLVASCIALSACSTYGPAPGFLPGYNAAPMSGIYGGGYSSYYSSSARYRGSVIGAYSGFGPYYFGSGRTTAFGYSPHYYRNHGYGHSSNITLGAGYDRLHRSSIFGGHWNSPGLGGGHPRRSLGHGVRHRRGH